MTGVSRRRVLRRGVALGTGAIAALSGCSSAPEAESGNPDTDGGNGVTTVAVGPNQNFVFRPGTDNPLEITTGTTVRFEWESDGHNIVVGSQPEAADWQGTPGGSTDIYDTGYTYERTFTVAGQYHYWCQPHKSVGMVADITVTDS